MLDWNDRESVREYIKQNSNCLAPYFYQVGTGVVSVRRTPVGRLAW